MWNFSQASVTALPSPTTCRKNRRCPGWPSVATPIASTGRRSKLSDAISSILGRGLGTIPCPGFDAGHDIGAIDQAEVMDAFELAQVARGVDLADPRLVDRQEAGARHVDERRESGVDRHAYEAGHLQAAADDLDPNRAATDMKIGIEPGVVLLGLDQKQQA